MKVSYAISCCKRVTEAAKPAYDDKGKACITSWKLGSHDFWGIVTSIFNKDKSGIHLLFNGPEVLLSASDKVNLFVEIFSNNSNSEDSGNNLAAFLSRSNLKLHNVPVTPTFVETVITDLNFPKTSGPNRIPVVNSKKSGK